ncbi:LysR family transcriptional regulator [Paenibacillus sp. Leaf72]|uniref:LysR family transcriptional regulator n=1 Tax=Paenibacillus sp. Leaf72 TaxID=1736234 RepID=UPI0006F414EE|nr:LysR family transcriptional regulator [Paenibacillus sp. Leaf72]KQN96287.1 LysR family transcriptional regulator [Paenibacillus sp. Leaf72]
MSINKYEIFVQVARLGSLTKAAETLGFTQSGVSHAINSLESEIGFRLLQRSRAGIQLTAEGERLLQPMREVLQANVRLQEEIAAIRGLEAGTIRIGTFTSVSVHWLPRMMKAFLNDYPQIEFKLMEGDYQEVEEWLEEGQIDCGFFSLPTSDKLEVFPLKEDRMLCILPQDHPMCGAAFFPLARLAEEPFIIPKAGSDHDVRRVLKKAAITPNVRFEAGDDAAIIAMVEQGLGISILPELVIEGRKHHVHVMELEEPSFRSLGIAVHSMKFCSPATRRFLAHVQSWLDKQQLLQAINA